MTKTERVAIATELERTYNPYVKKAIKFMIDGELRYIFADEVMTREEIKNAYIKTATKDIENGYNERMVGYYDKWYRYSHADEGRAYDAGQKEATKNPKCSDSFTIIAY